MPDLARSVHTVIPAQLSFLAIYNPSLGKTDETLQDQVVYYHSARASKSRSRKKLGETTAGLSHAEQNERLRQIGLAQGMVEFAKAFSSGEALDAVESEKSRILLHELETGWWILVSIDLTRLESIPDGETSSLITGKVDSNVEYSAREVCPSSLLLQSLLRAHSIFLLHHAPTLAELYGRLGRARFCGVVEDFWSRFVRDWDVLLHGNPATDIYNGLKLAAGGELGIGVGEEEWGSGEREVLEGFIGRTDGLVDMFVSRFGDRPRELGDTFSTLPQMAGGSTGATESWLGKKAAPRSSDGVIFSGVGSINRHSTKSITAWMEWLYRYGHDTYGVENNPQSDRGKRRRRVGLSNANPDLHTNAGHESSPIHNATPASRSKTPIATNSHIPPPLVTATSHSSEKPLHNSRPLGEPKSASQAATVKPTDDESSTTGTDTLMKYLTLGVYGSSWGIPIKRAELHPQISDLGQQEGGNGSPGNKRASDGKKSLPNVDFDDREVSQAKGNAVKQDPSNGHFLIGLQGNLDDENVLDGEDNGTDTGTNQDNGLPTIQWNRRTFLRTLYVQRVGPKSKVSDYIPENASANPAYEGFDRLRVVVYVRQPFIFTFLFDLHTDSLPLPSLYRSLHHQLGPLLLPLLSSTSPTKVASLLHNAASPTTTTADSTNSHSPIYDLIYDPSNLTIHTTIPNIPESGTAAAEGLTRSETPWSRIEALNVHSQILNTYISTRRHASELERTCKTSRGWWVVWMRLPQSEIHAENDGTYTSREAILIRKASDYLPPTVRKASVRFGRDTIGNGWGPGKLAEGIGIDTRRYIEGLLSLNR